MSRSTASNETDKWESKYEKVDAKDAEVLQWAREHGCEWDSLTCVYAARNEHLDVLQWAKEHGCPE